MINIIESKEIKVNESNVLPITEVKSGSDVTLNLELYKDNMPVDVSNQTLSLAAIREDGIIIEQTNGFTIDKNKISVKLKNNILQINGIVLFELIIFDNQGTTITSNFKMKVNKAILTTEAISANDIETIALIKKAEKLREQNEIKREEAEQQRRLSESNREEAENKRKQNENERISNENNRQKNEEKRIGNEETRVISENNRNTKEEAREENEKRRVSEFSVIKNDADKLIEEMKKTLVGDKLNNLEKEIINARNSSPKLGDRLNAIDVVNNLQNERLNNIEAVNNAQQQEINKKLETVNWGQIQGKPETFPSEQIQNTPLWEGALYLFDGQSVRPQKTLQECRTGWALIFSKYEGGSPQDFGFNVHVLPKNAFKYGEKGVSVLMSNDFYDGINNFNDIRTKYLYVNNSEVRGHERNDKYGNEDFVLRYVYEF